MIRYIYANHIYVYIYIYIHKYTYIYNYTYTCVCICISMYTHTYMCIYIYTHLYMNCMLGDPVLQTFGSTGSYSSAAAGSSLHRQQLHDRPDTRAVPPQVSNLHLQLKERTRLQLIATRGTTMDSRKLEHGSCWVCSFLWFRVGGRSGSSFIGPLLYSDVLACVSSSFAFCPQDYTNTCP